MRMIIALIVCICLSDSSAIAQGPGKLHPAAKRGGPSVSVQLPTFHVFSSSSTVLVPDRGRMSLGGIGRFRETRNSFRTPLLPSTSRATESLGSASETSVTAWIHDFVSMDRSLLQQAAALRGAEADEKNEAFGVYRASSSNSLQSVAEIRRQQAAQDEQLQLDARRQFARGQAAETVGKLGAAKVYYQMRAGRRLAT